MQNLVQRLLKMQEAFNSNKLPHQKYHDSMAAGIDKLSLSELPLALRKQLMSYLSAIKQIVENYPIETFEDYQRISSTHLDEMMAYAKKIYRLLCRCEARIGPSSS